MEFLATIGAIAIIIGLIVLAIQRENSKEAENKKYNELFDNSIKCQDLIFEYEMYRKEKRGESTSLENRIRGSNTDLRNRIIRTPNFDIRKECIKILENDPEELEYARNQIKRKIESEENRKREYKQKRKYAYKHELEVFSIFNDYQDSPSKNEVINSISHIYRLNKEESRSLYDEWLKNWLIEENDSNENLKIGIILDSTIGQLDDNDLTYEIWKLRNKVGVGSSGEFYKFSGFEYSISIEDKAQVITLTTGYNKTKKIYKPFGFDLGTTILIDENITIQEIVDPLNVTSFDFPRYSSGDNYIGIKENEPIKISGWSKAEFLKAQEKIIANNSTNQTNDLPF